MPSNKHGEYSIPRCDYLEDVRPLEVYIAPLQYTTLRFHGAITVKLQNISGRDTEGLRIYVILGKSARAWEAWHTAYILLGRCKWYHLPDRYTTGDSHCALVRKREYRWCDTCELLRGLREKIEEAEDKERTNAYHER